MNNYQLEVVRKKVADVLFTRLQTSHQQCSKR